MQTTLRIEDRLYRQAKAEAALAGVSLTRFIEEGLRLRLGDKNSSYNKPHSFRVYASEKSDSRSWEEIRRIAEDEQNHHELSKLGIEPPES